MDLITGAAIVVFAVGVFFAIECLFAGVLTGATHLIAGAFGIPELAFGQSLGIVLAATALMHIVNIAFRQAKTKG